MLKTRPALNAATLLYFLLLGTVLGQDAASQKSQPSFSQSIIYQPRDLPEPKSKKQNKTEKNEAPVKPAPTAAPKVTPARQGPITIPVSLFDASAKFVSGLESSNFRVLVDGKKTEISSVITRKEPLNLILLVDTSPSTLYTSKAMRQVATSLVEALNDDDKVMIMRFEGKQTLLAELTEDRPLVRRAIREIEIGGDGTSLYDSIRLVFEKTIPRITGRAVLVVLTDGVDSTSKNATYASSLAWAEYGDATIFPVFFDTSAQNSRDPGRAASRWVDGGISGAIASEILEKEQARNKKVAAMYELGKLYLNDLLFLSGGRAIPARSFRDSPKETADGIIAEIRQQYFVTFSPPPGGIPGQRKQLLVRVDRPNLAVLARGSYIVRPL
jgi:VWFA-related protein